MTRSGTVRLLSPMIMISGLPGARGFAQGPRLPAPIPSVRVGWIGAASARNPYLAIEHRRAEAGTRTYWLEGGAIGAVVLGVTSYLGYRAVAATVCSGSDAGACNNYRTPVTVGGAAVGFLVGALIGRRHVKRAR